MKIEAVTVCVGYGDFLAETLPHNLPLLDRLVVVTSPDDEETRAACRKYHVECVTSDEHDRDGFFSKGRLIDRGISLLELDGWVLHLDADVILPIDFKKLLDEAHLEEDAIYGCDRLNVVGYDAWQRVKSRGLVCRTDPWKVDLDRPDCRLGARVCNQRHGYTPIGFFQLWHGPSASWRSFDSKRYPHVHGSAARTDVQHALQWDRRKRVLLPELLVWHLESEPSKMGVNWKGRRSARFGPPLPPPPKSAPVKY